MTDGRCRFGPRAKREMVARLLAGETAREVARSMGCSPTTVTTTRDRWRAASETERASGAWCAPRRPVPRSCPWALSAAEEQSILDARARTNYGPMRLTWLTGRHRSTCWKVLWRHGVSRQRRTERPANVKRYEWTEAGALLHIDAMQLPKFAVPGHWAHGDRGERHRTRQAGTVKVIGVIDDHTRLAYCEIHAAETAAIVSATLRRAAQWFGEQGCGPVQAVMSDNARCYSTSRQFRATLAELGARHILIPPRTPRWNGKIERFFRTLDTEWAHGRTWPNSTTRDRALSSFIRFYNRRRPHTAAGGRPPISRVHQVRGQNS
jgi:transposase InsO family protein